MKIAVINFSGNVGKSTVARHLLLPRVEGADLISVESLNATYPYYLARLMGGLMVLSGMFLMAWNVYKTYTVAKTTGDLPVLAPDPSQARA